MTNGEAAGGTYFLRAGNALRVMGELTWDVTSAFDQACRSLVAEVEDTPVLDLTGVDALGSTQIGIIAATASEASGRGGWLTIVASDSLKRILSIAELDRLATIEYAEVD